MLKSRTLVFTMVFVALISVVVRAQEPVVGVADPEKLFTSPDPKLNANKQAALHIVRDLLECGHWNEADKYLTKEYLQHNPLVVSGRDPVVKFFTGISKPKPIPAKMATKIVAVIAEGDLVMVAYPRDTRIPKIPARSTRRRGSICGASRTARPPNTGTTRRSSRTLWRGTAHRAPPFMPLMPLQSSASSPSLGSIQSYCFGGGAPGA